MTAQEFISHLGPKAKAHKNGDGWMCCCPAHEDRTPSLSVKDGQTTLLLHCFAGCSHESVVAAAGLTSESLVVFGANGDQRQHRNRISEARREREANELAAHTRVAELVRSEIKDLKPAKSEHSYLRDKNVMPWNVLEDERGDLLLPLEDEAGAVWSCQTIDDFGDKKFKPSGRVKGCVFWVNRRQDGPLAVCEGYATGATIHEATGWSVACAMNCNNLVEIAPKLRKLHPDRTIIICADNDRGTSGNPGLEKGKAAASAIKGVLCFPDFPENSTGTDFNDLYALNPEKCVSTLTSALPCPMTVLSFSEILAIPISQQDKLYGDHLLDKGGRLTILGQGGVGKSRFIYQLIAAAYAGYEKFLTFDIHPGARNMRWLILQCENSVIRLQDTAKSLKASLPASAWMKFDALVRTLTPTTETDSFLNIDNPDVRRRIERVIEYHVPDGIIFDSLYDFSAGDLNKDADMRATLTALSRLTRYRNPKRAMILLHHATTGQSGHAKSTGFDRASFARNSKVIYNWSRAQINLAPMEEDNNSTLAVSCGKCSDGKEFPPFAVKLNDDTMFYDIDSQLDVAEWGREMQRGGREKPAVSSEEIALLCQPAMPKAALFKAIQEECGCGKTSAFRYVRKALKSGHLKESDGKLFKGPKV